MKFLLITNSASVAEFALRCGVDRIFIDLEVIGKQARQGHLDTVISHHSLADVVRMRAAVPREQMLVRVNPLHAGSADEVEAVLAAGAGMLMLPMFRTAAEVRQFSGLVAGRARICLLVETVGAAEALRDCVRVPGIDEVHIGLNDLHLEMGLRFMFELLADGTVDRLAGILQQEGVPFGIGGLARAGEGLLPAELLLAEHVRLNSTAAILSRTFHRQARNVAEIQQSMDFAVEVGRLRAAHAQHQLAAPAQLARLHQQVQQAVSQITAAMGPAAAHAGAAAAPQPGPRTCGC